MIRLRNGRVGLIRMPCHVLEVEAETTPEQAAADMEQVHENIADQHQAWGNHGDAVIVLAKDGARPEAVSMAVGGVIGKAAARTKYGNETEPAVLVTRTDFPTAICVYPGETTMTAGESIVYETAPREPAAGGTAS